MSTKYNVGPLLSSVATPPSPPRPATLGTSRAKDLTGQPFGRWTVLAFAGRRMVNGRPIGQSEWRCRCECGRVKERVGYAALTQGTSQSCGCLHNEQLRRPPDMPPSVWETHPHICAIWSGIKTRCYNKKSPAYKDYGGRGIKICPRWLKSPENFVCDMGPRPPKFTVERKDNMADYSPENCIWATRVTQANNTRRNRKMMWKGEQRNFLDIAQMENVRYAVLYSKVFYLDWSVEAAIHYCRERGFEYREASISRGAPHPKSLPRIGKGNHRPPSFWKNLSTPTTTTTTPL